MQEVHHVILKSGKDQSVKRFHPWIFSGAIKKIVGNPGEGDLVRVLSNKEEILGTGHYQIGSIAVRMVSFEDMIPDYAWWGTRIREAHEFRHRLGLTDNPSTNVYRLINGEGDNMPGLIVDYYNGHLVMQAHSIGFYRMRKQLADILKDIYGDTLKSVYDKSENTLPQKADIQAVNEHLFGTASSDIVMENDLKFKIDWKEGQKTGFFIDQRENRKLLETYAGNKSVLNLFSYTGGFSVYAMRGGATEVHSVDSSPVATNLAEENIRLNFKDDPRHKTVTSDAFGYLDSAGDKYDIIILDPPAFAKHQNVLPNALQGYKRLNCKALMQIKNKGIVFTFSCSQVVSKENFRKSVFAAAANAGRRVKIMHQLTQPPDHAVSIYHPEGEYLKGLVLYVE